MISADFTHHFHIARTADTGHFGTQRLGNLHRERANPAGSAVDQHLLARLHLAHIAQAPQCGQRCGRNGRGLGKREIGRFQPQRIFRRDAYSANAPEQAQYTSSPG